MPEPQTTARAASALYRLRWPAALLMSATVATVLGLGSEQVSHFSAQVAALDEQPASSEPAPQIFDPRSDIWFDPEDAALAAYGQLEDRFVAEDYIFVAFEDRDAPFGVFDQKPLEVVAALTQELKKIPYVRNVRSLTENPWIRWGQVGPDEQGLIVSDLFAEAPGSYTQGERLQRMVAVLGAQRAAALVGEDSVRELLGPQADFADHQGEPRLLRGIVSEDGRATAIQVQVLRPPVSEPTLDSVFGAQDSLARDVGPVIHKSLKHSEVVTEIERIIANQTDYAIHLTGSPVIERHFRAVGQGDMQYVGLMFVVIALLLGSIYRRISGATLPLLVVFGTIFGMVGALWMSGNLLNNLTAVTPTVVTAVGIADAVHLVSSYFLLRAQYTTRAALVTEVIARNAMPVLLTSVTTAVGFLSLASSRIVPVREFGLAAGLGTVVAYLLSMSLLPALLSVLPLPARKQRPAVQGSPASATDARRVAAPSGMRRLTDRMVGLVIAHRITAIAITVGLFGVALIGVSRVQFATDMRLMFAKGDAVSQDIYWWERNMGGVGDLELLFYGPATPTDPKRSQQRLAQIETLQLRRLERGALTPEEQQQLRGLEAQQMRYRRSRIAVSSEFLTRLDAFQRRLEREASEPGSKLALLARFDSPLDVLRKMHQVQNENRPAFYRVPDESDVPAQARQAHVRHDEVLGEAFYVPPQDADSLIAQYYLQYENGARPSENLASLITADRRGLRMTIRLAVAPSVELLAAFDRIRDIAREEFPELAGTPAQVASGQALSSMTFTGKQYMFTNMFQRFSETMVESLSLALAAITLLIVAVFRSLRLGLISLVPNLLPILLPLSVFGLLGVQIDGPSVVVASVALGVCVDDTIHLFWKFSRYRNEGLAVDEALRRAFGQVGGALTFTTVTLVLGFSVLTLGTFRPNIVTGYLGASMVALAWVADFLLTPALLSLLGERAGRPARASLTNSNPQPTEAAQ